MKFITTLLIGLLATTASASFPTTNAEIECLAKNIYFEARGEPLAGQFAVAYITLNRVEDSRWSDTICEVVYEPGPQFAWTANERAVSDNSSWETALLVARTSISLHIRLGVDTTDGAVYFTTGGRESFHDEMTLQVGGHTFYK